MTHWRQAAAIFLAISAVSACRYVSFERSQSPDEMAIRQEIASYYGQVAQAFAAENAQALETLYDPAIAVPMTQAQILKWAQGFFQKNKEVVFELRGITFERLAYTRVTVLIDYRVHTAGAAGDFGGKERDVLVRRGGKWFIASWEKIL